MSLSLTLKFDYLKLAVPVTAVGLLVATYYSVKHWFYSNYYVVGLPPLFKIHPFVLVTKIKNAEFVREYYKQSKLLGSLFCIELPFFPSPTVICGDIGFAKIILAGNDKYDEADKALGNYDSVFKLCKGPNMIANSSKDPKVHSTRKGLSQSFSTISLNKNFKAYNATLAVFLDVLSDKAKAHIPVDISTLLTSFTFDFLTSGLLKQDFHALSGEDTEGGQLLRDFKIAQTEFFYEQIYDPFRVNYFWNKDVQRAKQAHERVVAFVKRVIQRHRDTHSVEEIIDDSSILGHLLSSDTYASDEERVRDLIAFTVAGFDTTKATLAWFILEVTNHPEVLLKIQQELDHINPDRSVPFDVSHVSQLDYTVNAIKEAMRLWPAIPGGTLYYYIHTLHLYTSCFYCFARVTGSIRTCSQTYHYNGFTVPKGCLVWMNAYNMMRTGISNPDAFAPSRWEKTSPDYNRYTMALDCTRTRLCQIYSLILIRCRLPEVFITFSLGRRNCIGMNLAMLETKLAAATILRSFTFERVNKGDIKYSHIMTIFPEDEYIHVIARP